MTVRSDGAAARYVAGRKWPGRGITSEPAPDPIVDAPSALRALEIHEAQARELERLQHGGLERVEAPHVLLGRRHREEDRLRRARVRLIDVKAHAGHLRPRRDHFRPLVDDEPRDARRRNCSRRRLRDDRQTTANDRPGQRGPAVALGVRQLTDVERQRFGTSGRLGAEQRLLQTGRALSHVRRSLQPRHRRHRVAALQRGARRERCGHVRWQRQSGQQMESVAERCDNAGPVILGSRDSAQPAIEFGEHGGGRAASDAKLRRLPQPFVGRRRGFDRSGKRCSRSLQRGHRNAGARREIGRVDRRWRRIARQREVARLDRPRTVEQRTDRPRQLRQIREIDHLGGPRRIARGIEHHRRSRRHAFGPLAGEVLDQPLLELAGAVRISGWRHRDDVERRQTGAR